MFTAKTVIFRSIFYSSWTALLCYATRQARPEEVRLFVDSWLLWREPILAGICCGLLSALLGVYILLNRVVFISLGIAQGASFGIFLSFLFAMWAGLVLHESLLSLGFGLVVALGSTFLFAWPRQAGGIPEESWIGLLYVAASGLTLLIADRVAEGHHNVDDLLFGNAVAVTAFDLKIIAVVTVFLFAVHFFFHREFLYTSADPEFMQVKGMSPRFWKIFLYFTLTLGITFTLKTLGSLPIFVLMVIPPLISLKASRGIREAFFISLFLGLLLPPLGYFFSYVFALPTGASIIGTGCLYLLASLAEEPLTRRLFRRRQV